MAMKLDCVYIMPRRRKEIIEIKEFIKPSRLLPIHNDDYTELIFFLCSCTQKVVKFKDFYVSNHGQKSQNYKSYHFIIGGKELNDDEINKFKRNLHLMIIARKISIFLIRIII